MSLLGNVEEASLLDPNHWRPIYTHTLGTRPTDVLARPMPLSSPCPQLYGLIVPPLPASGEEALADAEVQLRGAVVRRGASPATGFPWGGGGQKLALAAGGARVRKMRKRRRIRNGRSFDLDAGDRSYAQNGGVETVRVRACQEGLRSAAAAAAERAAEPEDAAPPAEDGAGNAGRGSTLFGVKVTRDNGVARTTLPGPDLAEYAKAIDAALRAMRLSCPPRGSRELFVEQSAQALYELRDYVRGPGPPAPGTAAPSPVQEQNFRLLLRHSAKLIELRALDALLRTLRDRHLIVAARLRRTRSYWKFYVNLAGGRFGDAVQAARRRATAVLPWLSDDRDRNQREFELATATWERELEWLGAVEGVLLARPREMEASDLLTMISDIEQRQQSWWSGAASILGGDGGDSAIPMAESVRLFVKSDSRMWIRQTEEWNRKARAIIKESLDGTISSSFTPLEETEGIDDNGSGEMHARYAESRFLARWAAYDDRAASTSSWLAVLSLVDYAASPTRAGEHRQFQQLRQLRGLTSYVTRYDFLGLPSSALLLAMANALYNRVFGPNKQEIIDFVKGIFAALWGILEFR